MFGTNAFGRFAQVFGNDWVKKLQDPKTAKDQKLQAQALSVFDNGDGAHVIDNSLFSMQNLAVEASYQSSTALINEYRAMALDSDVDMAIDDIVNAAVVSDDDEDAVVLDFDKVENVSEATQNKISEEFKYLMELLKFNATAYEKFRQWYIDGRQYFQVVVDDANKKEGIQRLVMLDPRALKKIKDVKKKINGETKVAEITGVETYYLYNPVWAIEQTPGNATATSSVANRGISGGAMQMLKLDEGSVAYVHSGILSPDGAIVYGHLEKARKPLNNLKAMRDGAVIYRITRSIERRAFYIDTGTLPKKAAEEYVLNQMNKHKSKMIYDQGTGKVLGQPFQQSMLEDFWLPRLEGGRGTEISSIQGATNLGEITDILYFQKILYRSLNVPAGRLDNDEATISLAGNDAEVNRDEWKFNKFITRLRRKYAELFASLLRIHLSLKNIVTLEEWDETFAGRLKYDFKSDAYLKDQEDNNQLLAKVAAVAQANDFVGIYFSKEWVQKNILKFDDTEIETERKKMEEEKTDDAELTAELPSMPNDERDLQQQQMDNDKEVQLQQIQAKAPNPMNKVAAKAGMAKQ